MTAARRRLWAPPAVALLAAALLTLSLTSQPLFRRPGIVSIGTPATQPVKEASALVLPAGNAPPAPPSALLSAIRAPQVTEDSAAGGASHLRPIPVAAAHLPRDVQEGVQQAPVVDKAAEAQQHEAEAGPAPAVEKAAETQQAAGLQQAAQPPQAANVQQAPAEQRAANLQQGSPAEQLRARVAAFRQQLAAKAADVERAWGQRLTGLRPRGVVIAAGSPDQLANAFVNLFVLRHSLGCTLPIVIMYWGNITADLPTNETVAFLEERIPGLEMVDASKLAYPPWHTPLAANAERYGWKLKAFAVYAAPFEEVLFLDSDATPVLNPESLFEHPSYRMAGSMFWPDIWCGDPQLFRELRMPSIRAERQTDSGVFLVHRRRHWLALEWMLWLNVENDVTYQLAYGDKDTYRAAFFLAGRVHEYHQVPFPVGMLLYVEDGTHHMRGFAQAHPNGSVAFLHRVSLSKFSLSDEDPRLMSHITLPSCAYFQQRGWRPIVVPAENFAPGVVHSSAGGAGGSAKGGLAAALAAAAAAAGKAGAPRKPAVQECAFDTHTLYDASRRCARYSYDSAPGDQKLPLFEIPQESHVGRAVAESAAAFRMLRAELAQRGPGSQLFKNSPGPAASR